VDAKAETADFRAELAAKDAALAVATGRIGELEEQVAGSKSRSRS